MPPAATAGCDLIPSERFYRFVNFKQEDDETDDIGFDPVPFSPRFISKSVHYGYYLLVGPDKTAAAYLGFDTNYTFLPTFSDRQNEIEAHSVQGFPYSYESRIANLLNTTRETGAPVSTDGFMDGTICEDSYPNLCASGSCQENVCAPKIEETCIKNSCQNNVDCVTGICIWDSCAPADGKVADGCPCGVGSSCASGQCDRSVSLGNDWKCGTSGGASAGAMVLSTVLSLAIGALVVALFS